MTYDKWSKGSILFSQYLNHSSAIHVIMRRVQMFLFILRISNLRIVFIVFFILSFSVVILVMWVFPRQNDSQREESHLSLEPWNLTTWRHHRNFII